MGEEKEKVSEGRKKVRSTFSMGQLDFERYNKLFERADEYGMQVENQNINAIRPYFATLMQFYKQIRVIVLDRERLDFLSKSIKKQLNFMENQIRMGNPTAYLIARLMEDVDEFVDKIYETKQLIGLGIQTENVLSYKKKWDRAARID